MAPTGWKLENLPVNYDLETKSILKKLPVVHALLAELKGLSSSIPDQNILLNTIGIQEAKDSSEIENIITTNDDIFKYELNIDNLYSPNAKEVQNYRSALKKGFYLIQKDKLLTNRIILEIQAELEGISAGYRKLPGTTLKHATTGEVIYTPPQEYEEIKNLMSNLELFINDKNICDYDPLIKMAIIHYQFESIHPFYDGNGRTGRIINILYLILEDILNLPILYLSNYIIKNKGDYYRLLQEVRDKQNWEEWLNFMIDGVEQTSKETIKKIVAIKELMSNLKQTLRDNYKFYSQDLLNNLFKHPYTRIEFVVDDLNVSRITAANYLNKLADDGVIIKRKFKTGNYYINQPLYDLLTK